MNSLHTANPRRMIFAVAGAVTGVVLTPILAPVVLGLFGFSAAGVVAGKCLSQADQLVR